MISYNPPGTHVLGKRWEFALTITNSSGAALNLTGAVVTVALGSGITRYFSVTAALADQTASPGIATAVFLPSDTAGMPMPAGGLMYYQVDVAIDATHVDAVAAGTFHVVKSLI